MPMTTLWQQTLGDFSIGKTDTPAMTDLWMTLFTANPTAAGSLVNEVSWSGYARINVTDKFGEFDSNGEAVNADEIDFGVPQAALTIAYCGFIDDPSAGDLRFYEQIPSPRTTTVGGRRVKFAPGTVTIKLI